MKPEDFTKEELGRLKEIMEEYEKGETMEKNENVKEYILSKAEKDDDSKKVQELLINSPSAFCQIIGLGKIGHEIISIIKDVKYLNVYSAKTLDEINAKSKQKLLFMILDADNKDDLNDVIKFCKNEKDTTITICGINLKSVEKQLLKVAQTVINFDSRLTDDTAEFLKRLIESMTSPKLVNLDFDDLQNMLKKGKKGELTHSKYFRKERIEEEIEDNIKRIDIKKVKSVILQIYSGEELGLNDIMFIGEKISEELNDETEIVWTAEIRPDLQGKIGISTLVTY